MLNLITETMLYFGRGAEPSPEPPEMAEALADCGHEIYPNEPVYISPSAGTIFVALTGDSGPSARIDNIGESGGAGFNEQCVRDRAQDLDAAALASALGYERSYVL
jgi:hypothetical protein